MPRMVLTTNVASAFAFHIFGDDQQLTAALGNGLEQAGKQFADGWRSSCPPTEINGFFELRALALLIVDESTATGSRGRTACLRPLRARSRGPETFLNRDSRLPCRLSPIASAIVLPMLSSAFAEIVATCAIDFGSLAGLERAS